MASTITFYSQVPKIFLDGTVDLDTDTLKLALVTSGYTFSAAHTQWADASASEVATGSGYTTGGETVTGVVLTNTSLDATDVTWTTLTKTFRRGVLYASKTANGLTNPLIATILFDDTPADVSPSAVDFVVQWNASGIATLSNS